MMRGIESRNEIDPGRLLRDTRTMGQRFADFFGDPTNISIVLICMAALAYYVPELVSISFLIGSCSFLYSYTRKQTLPFRLPQISKVKDFNDLKHCFFWK